MAITESDTDTSTLVGETAATLLPADEGWSIRPLEGGAALPDGKTEAIGAQAGDHVIAIVVASEMSRRIQVGPPPAEGLLDGLAPAIEAVAQVLGLGEPAEPVAMNPQAVVAEVTEETVLCALVDGERHLVTVLVTPPSSEPDDDAPDTATFEPIVAPGGSGAASGLEVLNEVVMGVTVELGRTRMPLRDILTVVPGSVIELDRAASSPVDVLVNGTLIARGEVVVIDEEFGIRITEVVGHDQSITGDLTP